MAKTSIVDQIVKSLAFEVEAVPQNDSAKSASTTNNTPLNLKIRVRNTDTGVLENAVLSVPKFGQPQAKPQRIKLVSSDQTILSFNVSMEADLVNKPKQKPRRHFFGGCLGTQYDDDDSPYVPTVYSAKTTDRESTSKSDDHIKQNFVLSKAKYNNTDSLQTYTKRYDILGKCKPGGCLDPPFGEEKYSYEPLKQTKRKVSTTGKTAETTTDKQDHPLSSSAKSQRSKENLSVQKLSAKIEDDSILSLETNSSKDTLVSKYSDSVITYPPEASSSAVNNNKYLRTRVTSEEKQRKSLSESIPLEAFFPTPKKHNRFIEKYVDGKNGKSKVDKIPSITIKDNIDKKEGDVKPDKLSEITSSIERVDFTATETSSHQELLRSNTLDSKTNKNFVTPLITKPPIDEKKDTAVLSKNEILTSDEEVDLRSKDEISSVMKTVCENDTTIRDLYLNSAIYAKSDDTIAISLAPETKHTGNNNDVSSAKDILPRKIDLKPETDVLKNNCPKITFPSKKYSDVNNLKDSMDEDISITSLITQASDNDLAINKNTSLSTQSLRTSPKTSEIKTNLSINADASQNNLHDVDSSLKFNNIPTSVVEDQTKKDIEQNWSEKLEYNDKDNNSLKDSHIHLLSEKVQYETNVSSVKKYLSTIQTPTDVVQGETASEFRTPTDNISQNVDLIDVTTATTERIHDINMLNKKNVSSSLQDDVTSPNHSYVVPVFPNVKDTDVLKNKGISSSIHEVESLPLASNVLPVSPIENTKNDKSIKPKESNISTKLQSKISLDQKNIPNSEDSINNITASVVEDQTKKDIEHNWSEKLEYNDKDNNSLKDSDIHRESEEVQYETNVSSVKKHPSTIQTPTDVVQGENASEFRTPTDNISRNVDLINATTATTEGIHDINMLNNKKFSSSLQDDVTSPNDSNVVPVFPNVKDTDVSKIKGISSSIHEVESLPLASNVIPVSPIKNTKNDKSIKPKESNMSTKLQSKTSLDEKNIPSSEDSESTAEHGADSSHIAAASMNHMKREYSTKPDSYKITDEISDLLLNQNISQPFDDITSRLNDINTKNEDLVRRDSKYRNENSQGEQDDNNTDCKNIDDENKNKHIEPDSLENSQFSTQDNRSLKDSNSHALNEKVQYDKKNSNSLLNVESTIQAQTDVIQNSNDNYELSLNNVTITNSKFNGNVAENVYFGSYLEPISLRDDDPKVKLSFPKNSIEYNNNTIDNYVTVDSDKFDDNSSTQNSITRDTLRMGFDKESIEHINSSHKNGHKSLKPNAVKFPNSSKNYNIESLNNSKIVNSNAEIGHKTNIQNKSNQNHEFMNSPSLLRQPVPAKLNSFEDETMLRTLPELEISTTGCDSKEGTYSTVRGSKSSLKRDAISLDFAFQSYVTDKKERTIKTVDIYNEPIRYPNDAITVIQALIRPLVNEIRIPVESEYDLTIEIKRASSPTRRVQIIEEHQSDKSAGKKNIPRMQKDYDNLINLDSCSGIHTKKLQDEFISNKIQQQLKAIYDQQLMPLHSTIKNLKQDIDSLIQQQSLLGKKVRSGKTLKPPRLVRVRSRCGCSRK